MHICADQFDANGTTTRIPFTRLLSTCCSVPKTMKRRTACTHRLHGEEQSYRRGQRVANADAYIASTMLGLDALGKFSHRTVEEDRAQITRLLRQYLQCRYGKQEDTLFIIFSSAKHPSHKLSRRVRRASSHACKKSQGSRHQELAKRKTRSQCSPRLKASRILKLTPCKRNDIFAKCYSFKRPPAPV